LRKVFRLGAGDGKSSFQYTNYELENQIIIEIQHKLRKITGWFVKWSLLFDQNALPSAM